MEEFQTIPTKELQELVNRLLKKSEAAHERYNKATEEYNQLMDRYYDCGDIIEEFKKRKGYDSKTNDSRYLCGLINIVATPIQHKKRRTLSRTSES